MVFAIEDYDDMGGWDQLKRYFSCHYCNALSANHA